MDSFYHIIKTDDTIKLGDIETHEDGGKYSFDVDNKGMLSKGVPLLFSSKGEPVFIANAYIIHRSVIEGSKDILPTGFHMLRYFRFLGANNFKWDDHEEELQRDPIFLYRTYLLDAVEKGDLGRTTAVSGLSIVRRFYSFCKRHGYITRLPFQDKGMTKYGQMITDCSISSRNSETKLQPLNDLDMQHIKDNWRCNGLSLEFRLMVSVALTTGLRAVEFTDVKPKHFIIPKGFKGNTLTGIWIGPAHDCKTKFDVNREVSMPIWLMKDINKYHESDRYKARKQLYFMNTGDMNPPAFINKDGGTFSTASINTLWSKLRAAIQENSNPHFKHKQHDCRATFGAYKLESLLSLKELTTMQALVLLMDEMGHKALKITMRYLTHYEGNPEKNQVPEIMMTLLDGEV
ncbi:putative uncharacterized protein [Moritella viscosa]|nr:site-specific integrase [Moritella viscosa]CED61984.1 putative uncharacterized protein [Moritella viscosa]SHO07787.1 Putative uncharacterized protein [Moritella viscosa]